MRIVLSSVWPTTESDMIMKSINRTTLSYLLSYYHKKDFIVNEFRKAKPPGKFYVDSGVFTARKKGKNITVDELIKYYHDNSDVIDWMFGLDQGSPEEHVSLQRTMFEAGVKVIPIFHVNYLNWKYLDEMLKYSHGYLSIGTYYVNQVIQNLSKQERNDVRARFYDNFFDYLHRNGYWPVKVHVLGTERTDILENWPWYSSDASNFSKSYVYGRTTIFNRSKVKMELVHPWEKIENVNHDWYMPNCVGRGREYQQPRIDNAVNCRQILQDYITELWEKKGVVWND